jgi:hypothetical protein
MQPTAIIGIVASVALVAVGLGLGGSEQHPANLFLAWLFATAVLEGHRRSTFRHWSLAIAAVVLIAAAYGVFWTVGSSRAWSFGALLVYIGMVGATTFTEYGRRRKLTTTRAV